MKLFISQPMNGLSNEEILAERDRIVDVVQDMYKDDEIEVVDSFFKDAPHDAAPLWFLGKSLECMSTADIVFFGKGWKDARGCRIERICAESYGLSCIEDKEDED